MAGNLLNWRRFDQSVSREWEWMSKIGVDSERGLNLAAPGRTWKRVAEGHSGESGGF